MAQPQKNNPADFLKQVLGRPVVVKLNSGVDYRGGHPSASHTPETCRPQQRNADGCSHHNLAARFQESSRASMAS